MLKYGESRGVKVNKSHAACYAFIAYQTAWLKYHYPAEYMCAVMTRANQSDLPALVQNCRKMGLRVMPPDINRSASGFENDEDTVYYGFSNIKSVGAAGPAIVAEREKGDFSDYGSFLVRMLSTGSMSKDVLQNLIMAGALDGFCGGNRATLLAATDYVEICKKMLAKEKELNERRKTLENLQSKGASEALLKKATQSVASGEKSYREWKQAFEEYIFTPERESIETRLAHEYELLGNYLTGNPFSAYTEAAEKIHGRVELTDVSSHEERERISVCGIVKDLKVLQRNRDGRQFCSFTLFDETGEIETKCYVEKYAAYGDLIKDGAALGLTAIVSLDRGFDDEEQKMTLSVQTAYALQHNSDEKIIITGTSVMDWDEHFDEIKSYEDINGYSAYYTDTFDKVLRKIDFCLSKDIINSGIKGLTISLAHI